MCFFAGEHISYVSIEQCIPIKGRLWPCLYLPLQLRYMDKHIMWCKRKHDTQDSEVWPQMQEHKMTPSCG